MKHDVNMKDKIWYVSQKWDIWKLMYIMARPLYNAHNAIHITLLIALEHLKTP